MPHNCTYPGCKRTYIRREHLRRHERDHANEQPYWCHLCPSRFNRKETLKRHLNELHQEQPANLTKTPTEHQEQLRISDKGPPPSLPTNVIQYSHQSRHIENYFVWFHPRWPIIHKATFQSCPQPPELVQAVIMVGCWTERSASPASRLQAESDHNMLMKWVEIKLLPLLRSSSPTTNVPLNPPPDSIPILQAIFITIAFSAFRLKASSPFAMTNLWYLIQALKNIGVYEQLRIDGAVSFGDSINQELAREEYQRLALFSFKLHLLLWSLFLERHPKFELSGALTPAMLKVRIPCPLLAWDSSFFVPPQSDGPSTAQSVGYEQGGILVSALFDQAVKLGDSDALSPLISWDFELGMCLYAFASKQPSQSNTSLIKNIMLVLDFDLPDEYKC